MADRPVTMDEHIKVINERDEARFWLKAADNTAKEHFLKWRAASASNADLTEQRDAAQARVQTARRAMTIALPILELHAARTGTWVDALDLVREWLRVSDV